jgi:hypothetical protein
LDLDQLLDGGLELVDPLLGLDIEIVLFPFPLSLSFTATSLRGILLEVLRVGTGSVQFLELLELEFDARIG